MAIKRPDEIVQLRSESFTARCDRQRYDLERRVNTYLEVMAVTDLKITKVPIGEAEACVVRDVVNACLNAGWRAHADFHDRSIMLGTVPSETVRP